MTQITLTPVANSSLILADGWSADSSTLRVQFRSGKTYDFRGLSPQTKAAYETAESKGKYLKQVIEKNVQGNQVG